MSFFQDRQGMLCRDLWVGFGPSVTSATLIQTGWELVPTTFDGVIEWAYIRCNKGQKDWTRQYSILYQDPGELADITYDYPVVVRVQGFVRACNLAPLGNWNGEKESAVSAKQYLTLCSHGQHEPWLPVLSGIRHIRQLAHNTLTRGAARRVEPEPSPDDDLHLSRRVFNKVRDEDSSSYGTFLAPMDDPEGWYPRVSTDWNVAEKILLSRTEADGGNVPCKWLIFGPGDFVDVAASFDVCYRGQKGVNVTLNILQVVLVIPKAEDEPQISADMPDSVNGYSSVTGNQTVIRTGFSTDGEDHMMRAF